MTHRDRPNDGPPKDAQVPIPVEPINFSVYGRKFANVIKLVILRRGDYLGWVVSV